MKVDKARMIVTSSDFKIKPKMILEDNYHNIFDCSESHTRPTIDCRFNITHNGVQVGHFHALHSFELSGLVNGKLQVPEVALLMKMAIDVTITELNKAYHAQSGYSLPIKPPSVEAILKHAQAQMGQNS